MLPVQYAPACTDRHLTSLALTRSARLAPSSLAVLAGGVVGRCLLHLDLSGCGQLGGKALATLGSMTQLRSLNITGR